MANTTSNHIRPTGNHCFIFKDYTVGILTESIINQNTAGEFYFELNVLQNVYPENIELNQGIFSNPSITPVFPAVTVIQEGQQLILFCDCAAGTEKLCEHQAHVLTAIVRREELNVFFNSKLRHEKIKKFATDYGLEKETDPDAFFKVEYLHKKIVITPRLSGLITVTKESMSAMRTEISIPEEDAPIKQTDETDTVCVVFKRHKYYRHLVTELYSAATAKDGKIKNPLTAIDPLEPIWKYTDPESLKFFTGIAKFQSVINSDVSEPDLNALKAIIRNPLGYRFFYHHADISENVTASAITEIKTSLLPADLTLTVKYNKPFYELSGTLKINETAYLFKELTLAFTYFLQSGDTIYLIDKLPLVRLIQVLKKKNDQLIIHASKFNEFKTEFLDGIEDQVKIEYQYLKPTTARQIKQNGFNETEQLIYLSDFGNRVMLTPVMRYGDVEIPVRSKRQVHGIDESGNRFIVKRDDTAEIKLTSLLIRQHQHFNEQLDNALHYFDLHKKHFLEEDWFLNTFEEWRHNNITILGFNELEGNKLNPHKVKIDIKVISGANWFNALIDVKFGKKRASLKQLNVAIRNKNKYVKLDDGTLGILPAHWIEKFADYFNSGEILDDETLQIQKINFTAVEQLFDQEMIDDEVKNELKTYRKKLADFKSITQVEIPAALNGTLRPYQIEGLNWLNFLDDFNFGGCLADDMGLGKSIQVIAFILSQRKKIGQTTNLIVVPTTLIFNWQTELKKFAPSAKTLTIYGSDRIKNTASFDEYEVILTSYNTLLSDIRFLKEYSFNYIFLDESQNIKNPETQRYKAVRLLKSRNKIAVTGTPVENNTFDLYSQFSFACPGLLGSKRNFHDIYSAPIDTFKSRKRTAELQNKISPFLLRRTKQQVAAELPEKTEMILYCEMKEAQRKIYDAYEKEFRDYISATTSEELKKNPMNVLKGLTKLRQICDTPKLLGDDELSGDGTSAKIEMLIEQIEDKAPYHKMLVFSQFVSMLELIKKELIQRGIPFVILTGSTRNREAVVNEFQNNPGIRVFLISLKAGGTGLNLTAADYVYLVDPWWNPAVENQAIDRSHRIGQNKNVLAIRLICPGTVEEKMMKLQESKKELADGLIKEDTFFKSLSKENLLSLFS